MNPILQQFLLSHLQELSGVLSDGLNDLTDRLSDLDDETGSTFSDHISQLDDNLRLSREELADVLDESNSRIGATVFNFDQNFEATLSGMLDGMTSNIFQFNSRMDAQTARLSAALDTLTESLSSTVAPTPVGGTSTGTQQGAPTPPENRPANLSDALDSLAEKIRSIPEPAQGYNAPGAPAAVEVRREAQKDRSESRADQQREAAERRRASMAEAFSKRYLLMTLGPLITFATVLNQTTSGFRLFLGAVNIMAMTLAPILLPVFVMLAAAMIALADKIWTELEPALADFYIWIFSQAVPALSTFVDWLFRAVDEVAAFIGELKDIYDILNAPGGAELLGKNLFEMFANDPWTERNAPWLNQAIRWGGKQFGMDVNKDGGQMMAPDQPPLQIGGVVQNIPGGGDRKPSGGISPEFLKALREVAREFTFQQQPQAQMTSLVQASRAAQLAAVGQSPYEQKMLERTTKTVEALDKAVSWLEKMHAKQGLQ